MRVALDISVLGDGDADRRRRAGIFRAAEQMTAALAARDDVDLTLVSSGDLARDVRARQHAAREGVAGARYVSRWRSPAPLPGLVAPDSPWRMRARESVLARALWSAVRPFVPVAPRPPSDDVDVYQSLFDPLPPPDETHARARFLLVQDLVPLVVPEFVEPPVVAQHREIWASIRPDRDWLVCPSAATRDDLVRHLAVPPERIVVAPLAADTRFRPVADPATRAAVRARYGIREAPYLLSVATIEPRKNLAHVIRSFGRLAREPGRADLQLVLVGGDGWMMDEIRATHAASAVAERIHFTGYVADEDLSPLYGGASAFVYVSFYEGFGLPVLEAMQCGVPVVVSDRTSLPEVVGEAGLLVDPTDEGALCDALTRVLADGSLREDLGRRARSRAAEFSWSRTAATLVEAYRRALASA